MKIILDPPAGIVGDDTDFSTSGYRDNSGGRFWRGRYETVGGWERLSVTLLTGVCRTVFGFLDEDSIQCFAFGLHNGLTVWQGGDQADITPIATKATGSITVSGTPIANETFRIGSQTFTFKAARALAGEVTISAVNNTQAANIVAAITADIPSVVTAVAVANVVNLTSVASGYVANQIILTEAATGITVSSGGFLTGGGDAFVPGNINGAGSGYGAGDYGEGDYGEPTLGDNFVMTWSFGVRYGLLYANPRGQGVYVWDGNTANHAIALTNAPAKCNYLLSVFTGQLMAFGCTDVSGNFNPACIRITDQEDPTAWAPATNKTTQQYFLEGNGPIVAARAIGQSVYVWTDSELHIGSFNGTEWNFVRLGVGGLCGPNAAIVSGQTAYWPGVDLQFYYATLGGVPQVLPCPIRTAFSENAALGQNAKIVGAAVSEFGEVVFYYADKRDGFENSRALRLSTIDGAWARDVIARTAFVDANPAVSPVGVTYGGTIYWHERGNSADGSPLSGFIETGDQYISPGAEHVMLREWRPDFRGPDGGYQIGGITLTITTQLYPQAEPMEATYMAASGQSKVDLRQSGLLARFKFSWNSSPAFARFGKQTIDFVVAGER